MVPHVPVKGDERLDRFGEHRDANERGGVAEVPHEEEVKEETMGEDDGEEEGCKEDDEDADDEYADEDGGEVSESHSSSGFTQEALALPTATLTGVATLVAGPSKVSQGAVRMVP